MSFIALSQLLNTLARAETSELEKPVAFDHEQKYSRTDFLSAVNELKQKLEQRSETRWLLVHENSYAFAVGFMALLAANKAVILPPNAQPGTIADLHTHADALLDHTLLNNSLLNNSPLNNKAFRSTDTLEWPQLSSQQLTVTVMTSGSTGQAKPITKALTCLEEEINGLEALWGALLNNTVVFASVSHQHIYGLLFRVLWPLCAGRAFSTTTHVYPEQLISAIKHYPRSTLVSSPAQLKRFPTAIDLSLAAPHIAAVFSSGGPLPLDAALNWKQRLGLTPIEVFGSTETGGVAWRQQNVPTPAEPTTAWQCFHRVAIHIDDDSLLSVLSPFIQSPGNGMTYHRTGDMAAAAAQGGFYLLGRADAIVKIEEKRLSLPAMEQHLQQSALVAEARVVPLPDDHGRLGAVIVLKNNQVLDAPNRRQLSEKLRAHLLTHYERVLLPRKWRFVEQLPVNSQGKSTLADLKTLFNSLEHHGASSDTEQRVLSLNLKDNPDFFQGHFPNLPILPGVVQLDIAVRQCAHWYPLHHFSGIEKLKFLESIVPGDDVTLTLHNMPQSQPHHRLVNFNYTLFTNTPQQRSLSSGRIVFSAEHAHG